MVADTLGSSLATKASPELVAVLSRLIDRGDGPSPWPPFAGDRWDANGRAFGFGPDQGSHHGWHEATPPSTSVVVRIGTGSSARDLAVEPAPGAVLATRRRRRQRVLREAAERFTGEAAAAVELLRRGNSSEPLLGWSTNALYSEATLDGLSQTAELPEVTHVGVPGLVEAPSVDDRSSRRTRAVSYAHPSLPQTGAGTIVAIIDGEVASHPWLPGFVETRQYTNEDLGTAGQHAQIVAGLIAADGPTYSGVAPDAALRGYKIIARNLPLSSSEAHIVDAVQQAGLDGADVVNCSFGVSTDDAALRIDDAFATLISNGVTVVKSAGNDPASTTVSRPSGATGLIVVGACTSDGMSAAPYSSGGLSPHRGPPCFVLAFGGVENRPIVGIGPPTTLRNAAGTSFSAAIVSGLAACLIEAHPTAMPADVYQSLLSLAGSTSPSIVF